MVTPYPKPEPRIIDPTAGITRLHSATHCEACGERLQDWPGRSRHHVLPKGQRGDDVEENIVILCGDGVRGCHGKITSHSRGWQEVAFKLRAHLESERPEVLAYLSRTLRGKYEFWLARHLPRTVS